MTTPAPNNQKLIPTPTIPGGPGFVATNTQPEMRPTMQPKSPMVVGETGKSGASFRKARAAEASKPSAPARIAKSVIHPAGTNALDASFCPE
jgi:hypothetical protein